MHYGTGIQIYYTSGIPDGGGASKLSFALAAIVECMTGIQTSLGQTSPPRF
jgi:hypothetical protein